MTTNHPDPTPPPAEPAPSLRPVEEPCGFAIIDDGEVRPCERPATGWRWYQDCGHEDMLAAACDQHENEGGRRLWAAEETLAAVGELHRLKTFDGYSDHHHAASVAAIGAIAPYRHVCTEECFQRFTVCAHDGQKWPCPTAALAEGASR